MTKIYQCPRCTAEEFELLIDAERGYTAICRQCLLEAPLGASEAVSEKPYGYSEQFASDRDEPRFKEE